MYIFKPPSPIDVSNMPNLSKGQRVFDACVLETEDEVKVIHDHDVASTRIALTAMHAPGYVESIMEGSRADGYGMRNDDIANHSLQSCAILRASAHLAVVKRKLAVFAPVSGFHHAGYGFGGGFCTFNGLVLAADHVRMIDSRAKVLIIDGDGHHGNGTVDLIRGTAAITADSAKFTGRREWLFNCDLSYDATGGNVTYANIQLDKYLKRERWSLVIYQAGADCHIEDPYGSGYLTTPQWTQRDLTVFEYCKAHSLPLVFCLAGGYNGLKTIKLHSRTFAAALQVYEPLSSRLPAGQDGQSTKAD